MKIETVRVVDNSPENDQGFKIINREDLAAGDKLYDEAAPEAPPKRRKAKD